MTSMGQHVEAMLTLRKNGRDHLRLRQQPSQLRPRRPVSRTPSTFRVSFPNTFVRCFAKGTGHFVGSRSTGDPEDIERPISWRSNFSQKRNTHALDEAGDGENSFSRIACANLLARLRRTRRIWPRHERSDARAAEIRAPIVIGRDHLDTGSVASPNRETEAMNDGSDAIADWPLLNATAQRRGGRVVGVDSQRRRRRHRLCAARGHGGGRRRRPANAPRAWNVYLTTDPGMGVSATPTRVTLAPSSSPPRTTSIFR